MSSLASKALCRSFVTSAQRCAKPGYFIYKFLEKEEAIAKRAKNMASRGPSVAHCIPHENTRRQSVLNSLYLDTITDILGSEFAGELQQYRIQIHNVRILKNLEVIHVYWSCDESGIINREAAEVLASLEPKIRKEIGTVRHMGTIPRVQFVFYTGFGKANAVHTILNRLRRNGELNNVEPAPIPLKERPQVYGLDRDKILGILAARSLPADFLAPASAMETESRSGKSAEDFISQFRKSKFSDHRAKDPVSDFLWKKAAEELVLKEQFITDQKEPEDRYEYDDEEDYCDDYEPIARPREDDE